MRRKMVDSLRQSDFDSWSKYEDFVGSAKTIGRYHIELLGGTDRGAEILIWEPGYDNLEYIFPPSDNKEYHKADSVNFWYYSNALEEYRGLKTVKDIIALMWRNM